MLTADTRGHKNGGEVEGGREPGSWKPRRRLRFDFYVTCFPEGASSYEPSPQWATGASDEDGGWRSCPVLSLITLTCDLMIVQYSTCNNDECMQIGGCG
jgi:hypothetical protein